MLGCWMLGNGTLNVSYRRTMLGCFVCWGVGPYMECFIEMDDFGVLGCWVLGYGTLP